MICLVSTALAAPQVVVEETPAPEAVVPEVVAEPLPAIVSPPIVQTSVLRELIAPSHLISTCRIEHEPFETQTCTPTVETVCQPVTLVNQKIAYEKKCKDIVSTVCPEAPVGGTVLVKREADPAYLYAPYAIPVAPSVPQVAFPAPCQEITTQHCLDTPIVVDEPTTLENCNIVTKVNCVPFVQQIPKTVCDQVETTVRVAAPVAPLINPLAYQHYLRF